MQNLVDSLAQHFQEAVPSERHGELNTFVVYNQRSRVTSSAKRKRQPGSLKIHQTPDGSFLDLMRNARDMLLRCGFDVPQVSTCISTVKLAASVLTQQERPSYLDRARSCLHHIKECMCPSHLRHSCCACVHKVVCALGMSDRLSVVHAATGGEGLLGPRPVLHLPLSPKPGPPVGRGSPEGPGGFPSNQGGAGSGGGRGMHHTAACGRQPACTGRQCHGRQ